MRDLAPDVTMLVKPSNEAAIRRGEREAVRENLQRVLNGMPEATQLFAS
jgi:hypothetical protein